MKKRTLTLIEIKETILACLTTTELPEEKSDCQAFLSLTIDWASKESRSTAQTKAWLTIRKKFKGRCSNSSDTVIWNELHKAMKEVQDAWLINNIAIRQKINARKQATERTLTEIRQFGPNAPDIFSTSYIQEYFPQFINILATE